MRHARPQARRGAAVVWLIAVAFAAGLSQAAAQSLPPVWQSWLNTLMQNGYVITPGASVVTSVSYCKQVVDPVFGTCFISDPNDPYVLPLMPVTAAEYVDPAFGQLAAQTLPNGMVVGSDFRLDPSEAELVIVNLPPQAAYFSYQGYVFSRLIADYSPFTGKVSPDKARADITGTYNNSIDNVTIAASLGTTGWPAGTVAFISTPNAPVASDMASQFGAVGGNPAQIFIDPIGPNVYPGLGAPADDFMTLMRYLGPADSTASTAWLDNVAANVQVFRIAPPASLAQGVFGPQTLRKKYYNTDESLYKSDIVELTTIMANWLKTQESKRPTQISQGKGDQTIAPDGTVLGGNVGFVCIMNGQNCNDDEQDGIHWNVGLGKVAAGNLFVILGVNQTVTNNTTQLSLSVTNSITNTGVVGVSQTNPVAAGFSAGAMTGSAAAALQFLNLTSKASPQLQADLPSLFVQIFTRSCKPPQNYCSQSFVANVPSSAIPYNKPMYVDQRAYVLPGYPNSADLNYLMQEVAIY